MIGLPIDTIESVFTTNDDFACINFLKFLYPLAFSRAFMVVNPIVIQRSIIPDDRMAFLLWCRDLPALLEYHDVGTRLSISYTS